jgi:hypothetical protein
VKDDVYEMCEVLYDAGGKCNRYMNSKNDGSTFSVSALIILLKLDS